MKSARYNGFQGSDRKGRSRQTRGSMTRQAYEELASIRAEFKALVDRWTSEHPYLLQLQEKLRASMGHDDYRVETPIVYNRAFDDIDPGSEIKIILVADNPGKNEQLAANNRYLVGQSGKLAEGWMRRELGIEFRREVIILNKTPVHTPKTAELGALAKSAGIRRERLETLLAGSQAAMADIAWRLFEALRDPAPFGAHRDPSEPRSGSLNEPRSGSLWPILWISGLGELKDGGLFEPYRDAIARRLARAPEGIVASAWAFNHFSMNQFSIEVRKKARPGEHIDRELSRIGAENRRRVFGI